MVVLLGNGKRFQTGFVQLALEDRGLVFYEGMRTPPFDGFFQFSMFDEQLMLFARSVENQTCSRGGRTT